jgi:glycosyltransferase involved in cell wall biosynthesis
MTDNNICMFITSNILGGHEFQSIAMARELSKNAHVDIILPKYFEEKYLYAFGELNVLPHDKYTIYSFFFMGQALVGIIGANHIRKLAKNYNKIIICAGTIESAIAIGFELIFLKNVFIYIPSLADRRLIFSTGGCLYNLVVFPLLNIFTGVITINKIWKYKMRYWCFKPVAIRRNQIPLPFGQLKDSANCSRVVYIGRLDNNKNIIDLIKVLDFKNTPINEFLIIGDGPTLGEIEKLSLNIRHFKINLLGWLSTSEIDSHLSKHDILVLNSHFEGEPLIIRECRIRGMRILVRSIDGVRGITKKSERYGSYCEFTKKLTFLLSQTLPEEFTEKDTD